MDETQGGPPLLAGRSPAAAIVAAAVVPALFGAICGFALGVDKTAYLIVAVLALIGGYFAGQEHSSPASGALRGLISGSLFGAGVLTVHALSGKPPQLALPHPAILQVPISGAAGAVASALGGRRRALGIPAPDVNFQRLGRPELVGLAGGVILLGSLFMPWFSTACDAGSQPPGCNHNSRLHGLRGSFDAFATYHSLQWILLVIAAAPLAAAYVLVVRGRPRTWRAGETAMIAGAVGFMLVLANGILLGRPGGDSIQNVDIALQPGYFIAPAACLLIAIGGALRESIYLRSRGPASRPAGSSAGASRS